MSSGLQLLARPSQFRHPQIPTSSDPAAMSGKAADMEFDGTKEFTSAGDDEQLADGDDGENQPKDPATPASKGKKRQAGSEPKGKQNPKKRQTGSEPTKVPKERTPLEQQLAKAAAMKKRYDQAISKFSQLEHLIQNDSGWGWAHSQSRGLMQALSLIHI
eukprot:8821042-Alexandrium_andersonii.AAC.1